jgi:1,2-phenylacetyl-CoA epoxidase catalytic subunit
VALVHWLRVDLGLAEVGQDRVDHLEGLVDLFTDLGASEDDLARDEDEKHLRSVSKKKKTWSRWEARTILGFIIL